MTEREACEEWFATHTFNFERDPIGSRECGLRWEAWRARAALSAPQPVQAPLFTADQLRTAQREAALMALEEAAKACAAEFTVEGGALRCYEAIRALRTELENTK